MELVLDHIGVVVKNISDAKDYYIRTYGCKVLTDIINEPAHNVDIMFLSMGHGSMPMFELIQPVNDKSKVSGFLKKTGGGIHHLAYEVANIDIAIEHFKSLMGLENAKTKLLKSTFNYSKNAYLYVPKEMPETSDRLFNNHLVNQIYPLLLAAKGRAFILSTSIKSMNEIKSLLEKQRVIVFRMFL